MGFADLYFSKQKDFKLSFYEPPSASLQYTVVIPSFREPGLIYALQSLLDCNKPKGHIEVIVVLNAPENADDEIIRNTLTEAETISTWMTENSSAGFRFLLMNVLLPVKDAGVGLARKTGMDQALHRLNLVNNPAGFLLSFDADSHCEINYFTVIEEMLEKHPGTKGFNVFFEHPVAGNDFPDEIYKAIVTYEMHLRYLNLFTRHTGFPHAFHTVGSCFGVRADAYSREGGMNKRKAGEDFYFLHKIIPLGEFREITQTTIFPSPRQSDRVPFGTGAAILKFVNSREPMLTYSSSCFKDLGMFFQLAGKMYDMSPEELKKRLSELPEPLENYLQSIRAVDSIESIRFNTGSADSFVKRFFRWFDAFRIIKYLNFASSHAYGKLSVKQAVLEYLEYTGYPLTNDPDDLELLKLLRKIEKGRL